MKTLAQTWAERLKELKPLAPELTAVELDRLFYRDTAQEWWSEFCRRAEAGEELSAAVWRAAEREAARRGSNGGGEVGWVKRLRVRNLIRRTGMGRYFVL